LRILHLTDPHLFADIRGELRGTVTYSSRSAVLDHYRSSDWNADIAVVTGDLIQDDSAAAYDHFRDLMAGLGMPVHCVPGNHDIRALMEKTCRVPPFSYCAYEEIGDWLLVGIDSCVKGEAGGRVSEQELERLTTTIADSSAKHVMVCLHHPPVPMGSTWLDSVGLANGDDFLERLHAAGRVRLAVFGHVHQAYDEEHDGIRIIATPSTCRQFKPRSDKFAVDDLPPAYRRINLSADGNFETELVWVGND